MHVLLQLERDVVRNAVGVHDLQMITAGRKLLHDGGALQANRARPGKEADALKDDCRTAYSGNRNVCSGLAVGGGQ